ncbi:MAG: alpha-galactosidase [Clostridiales bacterium]|nr:alpha-galactosidase [Clostridiales bacterium]
MKGTWNIKFDEKSTNFCFTGPDLSASIFSKVLVKGDDDILLSLGENEWKCTAAGQKAEDRTFFGCNNFITQTYEYQFFKLHREVCYKNDDMKRFYVRLIFENGGNKPVKLLKLVPFYIENEYDLKIGMSPYYEWSILRQGRHKNDLPSICIAGENNSSYRDCFDGLSESGEPVPIAEELPYEIVSDPFTVLRGSKGKGPGSLLIGFISGKDQLVNCVVKMDHTRKKLKGLEANCLMDGITVEAGEKVESEWLKVDGNENSFDAIKEYTKDKAKLISLKTSDASSAADKKITKPSVYCTWYFYGDSLSQQDVIESVEGLAERNIPCDVFLIDEGWDIRTGDWQANHRFSMGMKAIADKIRSKGMIPGIWTSPFIIEPRCDLQYTHPDWILKKKDGSPVLFSMNLMFNYVLDTTHPEVLNWIEELYRKLTFEWGYTYHKLDFTRAVVMEPDAVYYNPKATRAQAYRMGFEAVRRGAGEDAYILVCGGLYDATLGIADGQRTGSDVRSMWPVAEGESESAPRTIKQNVLRYWMNDLWDNDPDALMVRRRTRMFRNLNLSLGLLEDHEAETLALNQYWGGGQVCFSEPMKVIHDDRLGRLRHIIPAVGNAAIPTDMFEGKRYPAIMDTEVTPRAQNLKPWHTVSVANWSNAEKQLSFTLDEYTLGEFSRMHKSYTVSEFSTGRLWTGVKYGDMIDLGYKKPHETAHLKITPEQDREPALVYTNGHYSMGGKEIYLWEYDSGKLNIGVEWNWSFPLQLKIKMPKAMKLKEARSDSDGIQLAAENDDILVVNIPKQFKGIIRLS